MADLSPPRHRAIAGLLACRTVGQAAKTAGVGERTLTRWLSDPVFKAALAVARREVFTQAIDALRQAATEAVDTLRDILADETTSPAIRVQAAGAILAHAFKGVELVDVLDRINRLEELQSDAKERH